MYKINDKSMIRQLYVPCLSAFSYFNLVGNNIKFATLSWFAHKGLRFDKEIEIFLTYRDCLKVLRIVICKYTDLTHAFYQKYRFRAKSHFEACLSDWSGTMK